MKAQIQPISMVLVAGIVIAIIGTSLIWGIPLIEKRTTLADFSLAQSFILELDKKITEIASTGSGSYTLHIPTGYLRVIPYGSNDPDNNSIILELVVKQPLILNGTIPIKTTSLVENETYGEAEPRIITLTAESSGTGETRLKFKLHYRELDTTTLPLRGYKIALESPLETTGDISITFVKNEILPNSAGNGGDLVLTYVRVTEVY
ncbi:MAG: hypothetical protein DRP15_00170 [Candidatus Aenigmatarchaeota archaeon]|nr:MAG: hypothetical protein DRP15_00170 [Candidatus Aenigmarchaeota archaeon]